MALVHSAAPAALALAEFSAYLFAGLRSDQRRWALACLQAALSSPGPEPAVPPLLRRGVPCSVAAQSMHRFVNRSPWPWDTVLDRLLHWVGQHTGPPHFWTVGMAVLPKRGSCSVGVHRCTHPANGRPVNGQLGLGVFLSGPAGNLPTDWRLLLPEHWCHTPALRQRARIPEAVSYRSAEAHILDLDRDLTRRTWHTPAPLVVDLPGHVDAAVLAEELSRRSRQFVLSAPATLPVTPLRSDQSPASGTVRAGRLLTADGQGPHTAGLIRSGSVVTGHVALPTRGTPGGAPRRYQLFGVARPPSGTRPDRVWLSNLPPRRPGELPALITPAASTTSTVRDLERFGLFDFEGRSWPGWHHHMTLMSAAYTFSRLSRA